VNFRNTYKSPAYPLQLWENSQLCLHCPHPLAALQVFLMTWRLGFVTDCDSLVIGIYDNATGEAVGQLQAHLGFTGKEIDKHFGPATRSKLKQTYNFDLDSWRRASTNLQTIAVQPDGSTIEW